MREGLHDALLSSGWAQTAACDSVYILHMYMDIYTSALFSTYIA